MARRLCSSGIVLQQAVLLFIVACSLSEQQVPTTHTCQEQNSPQKIVSSETILLHLKHPTYHHLHPSQHCEIQVVFDNVFTSKSHRWLISVVNVSMNAYSASAKFFNSIDTSQFSPDAIEPPLTSETPQLVAYQFVTKGNKFSVVFSTQKLPEALSTGLVLLAEPFDRCPTGWFDTGISCYGMPMLPDAAVANKAESEAACSRLGGGQLCQGGYTKDHIDESIKGLLALRGEGGSFEAQQYWVGIVRSGGAATTGRINGQTFDYSNGFKIPYQVDPGNDCSGGSASVCDCVVYHHSGTFLTENCNARHRYICAIPLPPNQFCVAPPTPTPCPNLPAPTTPIPSPNLPAQTGGSCKVVHSSASALAIPLFVLIALATQ